MARRGLSLRVRVQGERRTQTVKLAGGAGLAMQRGEWEWPVEGDAPDLKLAEETPVREFAGAAHVAGADHRRPAREPASCAGRRGNRSRFRRGRNPRWRRPRADPRTGVGVAQGLARRALPARAGAARRSAVHHRDREQGRSRTSPAGWRSAEAAQGQAAAPYTRPLRRGGVPPHRRRGARPHAGQCRRRAGGRSRGRASVARRNAPPALGAEAVRARSRAAKPPRRSSASCGRSAAASARRATGAYSATSGCRSCSRSRRRRIGAG